MSKIFKIDDCGGCPFNKRVNGPSYDRFCEALYPKNYFYQKPRESKIKTENFSITDESKILPNCPLEDYLEEKQWKEILRRN